MNGQNGIKIIRILLTGAPKNNSDKLAEKLKTEIMKITQLE